MSYSPVLLVHICSGTVGLFSGGVAVSLRKGSRRHGVVGDVFVVSMLGLALTGIYMAVVKHEPGNILGGAITCYLVTTGWAIARRKDGQTNWFDWVGTTVSLGLVAVTGTLAVMAMRSASGTVWGYSPGPYILLGSVALAGLVGDIRMLVVGWIAGKKRLGRHLWRMCVAWFIASSSIFLARPHLFPLFMRKTGMLYFLTFLPILLMVFWLVRVLRKKSRLGDIGVKAKDADSLSTASFVDAGLR